MSIITNILIQIKFDIDINNDELLKTIWKHNKEIFILFLKSDGGHCASA
jgi:hypothetical protein